MSLKLLPIWDSQALVSCAFPLVPLLIIELTSRSFQSCRRSQKARCVAACSAPPSNAHPACLQGACTGLPSLILPRADSLLSSAQVALGVVLLTLPAFLPLSSSGRTWFKDIRGEWVRVPIQHVLSSALSKAYLVGSSFADSYLLPVRSGDFGGSDVANWNVPSDRYHPGSSAGLHRTSRCPLALSFYGSLTPFLVLNPDLRHCPEQPLRCKTFVND